jgi:hypothetical protein
VFHWLARDCTTPITMYIVIVSQISGLWAISRAFVYTQAYYSLVPRPHLRDPGRLIVGGAHALIAY